jgi:DNA mismatch repair protein MutH
LGYFSHLIQQRLILNVPLKTEAGIEAAVKCCNDTVQWAGWKATSKLPAASRIHGCPITIKQKVADKRKLRRDWHRFRTPESKRFLNAATQDLKQLLNRNKKIASNIPARSSTNGIHQLFLVQGDQIKLNV